MDKQNQLQEILSAVQDGRMEIAEGLERLRDWPYLELGHTKIDLHRELRNGFPEVIYAEGKTAGQVAEIFRRMQDHGPVLATRVSGEMAEEVRRACPRARYNELGRTLTFSPTDIAYRNGEICIVSAGTSDLPVAEEARETCEILGNRCRMISDVGVAGLHRLLDHLETIRKSSVIIVVAGMEGALASVVGGLVDPPVIGVPTSVGYGAALGGIAPLLGMLTSCASGVTAVNIDNGFGAACAANRINALLEKAAGEGE